MRKFRDWMIKNYGKEVWEKYKKNVKNPRTAFESTPKRLKDIKDDYLQVFHWASTPEGGNFWADICTAWCLKNGRI